MKLFSSARRAQIRTLLIPIAHLSVLQRIVIAFFAVSFFMLFVGDGKQHIVDLLGAIFAISAFYFAGTQTKPVNTIPKYVQLFWTVYIGWSLLSVPFSMSIGYSVTALARICIAYMLYIVIIQHARSGDIQLFAKGLSVFTVLATGVSFFLFLHPGMFTLPSMNLLYPTYGHNHLADILLFALPISYHDLLHQKSYRSVLFLCFIALGFSITFSRGALFIAGLYILFETGLFWTKLNKPFRMAFVIIGFIFVQSLLLFSFTGFQSKTPQSGINLSRLTTKPTFKLDGRLGYWQQAISGFTHSPIMGNGPGSFFLISKLYQKRPQAYSWFAHNFPLETLTEIGIIGFFIVYSFIAVHGIKLRQNLFIPPEKSPENAARTTLFHGIFLTSIYSLIEFNLNYLLIWMVFWSACAFVMTSDRSTTVIKHRDLVLPKTIVLFVLYFYISSILILLIPKKNLYKTTLPLYITPYSVNLVTSLLDNLPKEQTLTDPQLRLITIFHRNDPEVNERLGQFYEKRKRVSEADFFYQRTLAADPRNTRLHNDYFKFLLKSGESTDKIHQELKRLDTIYLQEKDSKILHAITSRETLEKAFTEENITENFPSQDYYVNLYHRMGLSLLPEKADIVKDLWFIMYRQNPGWSYFYIDFASLMKYRFNDTSSAGEILLTCQNDNNAGKHCHEYTVDSLPSYSVLRNNVVLN